MKKITIGIISIMALIALIGMYKFNYLAGQDEYTVDGNKIAETKLMTISKDVFYYAPIPQALSYELFCFHKGPCYWNTCIFCAPARRNVNNIA